MKKSDAPNTIEKATEEDVTAKIKEMAIKIGNDATVEWIGYGRAAEYWGGSYLYLGLAITVLSAAVSASIFSKSGYFAAAGGFISLVLVVISSVSTFLNPDQRTNRYYKAKARYQGLADRARLFSTVDMELKMESVDELCKKYQELEKEMEKLRTSSPRIARRYYPISEEKRALYDGPR